jgi:hypothetical protein
VLAPGATAPEARQPAPQASQPVAQEPARQPVRRPAPAPVEAPPAATTREAPARAAKAPAPQPVAPANTAPETTAPATTAPATAAPAAGSGPTRFGFAASTIGVREGDVAARITIRRSGNLSSAAEVGWWTEDGSAVADADYADLGARIERFAPGEASRTVFVPLTNDGVREDVKSFTVMLGQGNGEVIGRARVDIVDDD